MTEAVIFDLSGVFINRFSDMKSPVLNISDKEMHSSLKGEGFQDFLKGRISENEYWERVISKNSWDIDVYSLKEARRESFREIEGTREIIERVRQEEKSLGLLSSHTIEWTEFLNEKFDYEKYFNAVLYSYSVGRVKPDIKFYQSIIEMLQVDPKDTIYIDDKRKYLKPARELGMDVILFESSEQLKKDLYPKLGLEDEIGSLPVLRT